ncbi:hypothetical protein [Campylobacter sp. RM16187]|uniref:hypothetical protein n=1 Tax=Campylobacter sp. RM16187 TaxID=1660063 RepID=UPI0021B6208A|nr:hypothetical protein [Campylobacter sp. RM16187]QKG29128.1 hypothetical protein CDOMF_0858 [Campylobacter sp. RM16187]
MWFIQLIVVLVALLIVYLLMRLTYSLMPNAIKKEPNLQERFLTNRREMLKNNGKNPYVDLFSDDEITHLYNLIEKEFIKAAQERNESISPNQRLYILYEIIFVSGLKGKKFGMKHLEYELLRSKEKGIRPDNKGLMKWRFG